MMIVTDSKKTRSYNNTSKDDIELKQIHEFIMNLLFFRDITILKIMSCGGQYQINSNI